MIVLDGLDYPLAGFAVTVGINGVGHGGIGLFVGQERGHIPDNRLFVSADQFDRTHFDRFGAFGSTGLRNRHHNTNAFV